MAKIKIKDAIALLVLRTSILSVIFILAAILYFIIKPGISAITWEFLTQFPRNNMSEGGIFPCLVGTFMLVIISISVASVLGVLCAIYLTEYARGTSSTEWIRMGINNLAGIPSIVFGLFGLAFFVKYLGFGVSALSASLTLSFMVLPMIIRTAEEALLAVPMTVRESALALGATKWETTHTVVLPAAIPGILTGIILSIGRAAGETAPILFTGAAYYRGRMPSSIFDPVMALPYHLYVLATSGTNIKETLPLQYATATILLLLVLIINLSAVIIRQHYRKKLQW